MKKESEYKLRKRIKELEDDLAVAVIERDKFKEFSNEVIGISLKHESINSKHVLSLAVNDFRS